MIIPEPKLLITLEWHLGIPDGERKYTTVERYSNDTNDIASIITDAVYYSDLKTEYENAHIEHFYDNKYSVRNFKTGDRICSAKAETVLYFDGRIFKLEEI